MYDNGLFNAWMERHERPMSGTTQQILNRQNRQDEDGVAGLYYHDVERCLTFHWTGSSDAFVEVSHGGDHEPPRWVFAIQGDVFRRFETLVKMFKHECDEWITRMENQA